MRWLYLVLLLAVVAVLVAFLVENNENATVNLFNKSLTAPLSWFFIAVFFLGMWGGDRRRLRQVDVPPRDRTRGAEADTADELTAVPLTESRQCERRPAVRPRITLRQGVQP
jgi:hypothetical protein